MVMRRRELIALAGAAIVWPLAATAQQQATPGVGFLHSGSLAGHEATLAAYLAGLAEAGFIDGKNVAVKVVWADGHYDKLPGLVAELISDRVAVIAAMTLPSARTAKAATATIPIVFMSGDDPVKQGLVASLNRPGGNATGMSMLGAGLDAKRFQILHDLVPGAVRYGLLVNPGNPQTEPQISESREAAHALGRELAIFKARSADEIDSAFAALAKQPIEALVVGADPYFTSQARQIVGLTERYKIPAVHEWREFVDAGGLASYGSNLNDNFRHAGIYTGKILAGAKPADLPIQRPTRFELVISLKAAKALGLTVPRVLLAQADEVIE